MYSIKGAKTPVQDIKKMKSYNGDMDTTIRFHPIAWKSKVGQKRSTYNMTINKVVADGCNIEKGAVLHSYVGEDHNKRPIMITYLDGRERVFTNR